MNTGFLKHENQYYLSIVATLAFFMNKLCENISLKRISADVSTVQSISLLFFLYCFYFIFCKHVSPHLPYFLIVTVSVKCLFYFPVF